MLVAHAIYVIYNQKDKEIQVIGQVIVNYKPFSGLLIAVSSRGLVTSINTNFNYI